MSYEPRSMEELRKIAEEFHRRVNAKPWLGAIMLFFDSPRALAQPPVTVVLHGISDREAIRMMREQADIIERSLGSPYHT